MMHWDTYLPRGGAALEEFSGEGRRTAVYTRPFGRELICETADTEFSKGAAIPYQVHRQGHILAIVLSGRAEITLYGKRCVLEAGDLAVIEPYMPFGFRFPEACVLRTIFHGVDAARILREQRRIDQAGGAEREALLDKHLREEGIRLLPEPAAVPVEREDLPEVSVRGGGEEVFPLEGVTCALRAGRWQLGGEAEVWEYRLEGGKRLQADGRSRNPSLLMVCGGQVELELEGERRTAGPGDLLWIPPWQPCALTAAAEGAALLDCCCGATLLRYLEEWETARSAPEGAARQSELAAQNSDPLQGLA